LDAIDLEVIYQSTLQIARELTLNMLRTGYSTIIKESQDFTFAIFDAAGRMVAQGVPQPLHIGPLSAQVNEMDPYYPNRKFPKLITPQWVGEDGVECVVVLAIDDMRGHEKWETFLRPILERLKKIDGRAPVSIMTCDIDPKHEHLQKWLKEGLSLETHTVDPGALEAVKLSFAKNYEWTKMIFQTLGGLFTHETSVKQLMGPVAIADLSGTAAHAGWIPLFSLMAMISLNLGLLNLMPIPVLDGGHIFILALEGLARRDFSMKVKEKMLLGGFVLLLMLMVTVIYNDLMRIQWIEKLVPWR